jgi:gliding motility-associated-like protein
MHHIARCYIVSQAETQDNMSLNRYLVFFLLTVFTVPAICQDTEPPYFSVFPQNKTLECGITSSLTDSLTVWYTSFAGGVAEDNGGSATIQANLSLQQVLNQFAASSQSLCGQTQQITVAFVAIDQAGNTSSPAQATFATEDNLPPQISGGKNVRYNCVAGIRDTLIHWIQQKGGHTASDACTAEVQWPYYFYYILHGNDTISSGSGNPMTGPFPAIPDSICLWVLKANFVATDSCNQLPASSLPATFTVFDSIAPVLGFLPPDITVLCDQIPPIPPMTATDACDRSVAVNVSFTSSQSTDFKSCAHAVYTINRRWTAQDACNNQVQHTQKISVIDTLPPVFTGAAELPVSCHDYFQKPDSFYVKIFDNCTVIKESSFTDSVLTTGCISTIERRYFSSDACGNSSSFVQRLQIRQENGPILLKPAKNQSYDCAETLNLDALLQQWVSKNGGAEASSVCSDVRSFAAIKGSYTLDKPETWPGTPPTSLPRSSCPSGLEGFLRFIDVDFIFYDTCGNATVSRATFGVRDGELPNITKCPDPIQLETTPANCTASLQFQLPEATDNCSEPSSLIRRKTVTKITSPQPAGFKTIVDTAFVRLGPVNPNTINVFSDGLITIILRNMDIDGSKEYFTIFSESGSQLGTTPTGAGECESDTLSLQLPKDSIQNWLRDGFLDLIFAPHKENIDSIFFINNICGNSQLEVEMILQTELQNILRKSIYVNGKLVLQDLDTNKVELTFPKGKHRLTVLYEDCASNPSECNVDVTVSDNIPPVLVCPPSVTISLPTDMCQDSVALNTNWKVTEMCDGMRQYNSYAPVSLDASRISFQYKESTGLYEALSSQMVFRQVFPMRHIDVPVRLEVAFYGDNGAPEKTFELIGPGGFRIGKTNTGQPGKCGLTTTEFTIPAALFNQWIINGEVTLIAIPDISSKGIRPCGPIVQPTNSDGTSYIQARLTYSDAAFTISSAGATVFSSISIPPDVAAAKILLNGGANVLTLETRDGSGNRGNCRFEVVLADNQKPKARCKNALVQLDPSGLTPVTVSAQLLNDGSSDNCEITTFTVLPTSFDCSVADTDVKTLLIAEDKAGNRDTCITSVRVKSYELQPTYSAGLCANDTLKLFANLPQAAIPGTYSYFWDGPGNLDFFTENVLIPNVNESYNGGYMLTVKGFNDCISTGSVVVNVKPLTNPQLTASDTEVCENAELILACTQYTGEIEYQWYQGVFPSGVLLKKTSFPELILSPALLGANFFYVIAQGPDCSSNPSSLVRVNVLKNPVASVNDLFLSPCEGDDIIFGSPVSNPNFTFHWTGPAGYDETGKNPRIITNARTENAGNYYLVIKNKECISDTASTRVVIAERPPQPTIVSADIFCEGATFTLVAAASPNAERYEWIKDNLLFTVSQDNSLIIPNAQAALQGNWSVVAIKGNCRSTASVSRFIAIDNSLEVGAINSGPICAGDSVQLQATFVPNASYQWEGPSGIIPPIFNPRIAGVAGDYSVTITTPTGCQNNTGTTVTVIDVPEITALSNDARNCIEPTEVIRFFPSVFPVDPSFNYLWTGPGQFTSTEPSPVLSGLTSQDTGLYTLVVFNKGCPSRAVSTRVAFNLKPATPEITGPLYACTGDTIQLLIAQGSNANEFIWQTPFGQITTTNPLLKIANAGFVNGGVYTVRTKIGECFSNTSTGKEIQVRLSPPAPAISANSPVCFGDTLLISVNQPGSANYLWTGPLQLTGNTPVILIPSATKAAEGVWSVKAEKDGCVSTFSNALSVTIKDEIKVPVFATDLVSICQDRNNGAEICFQPSSLQPNAIFTILNNATGTTLSSGSGNCIVVAETASLLAGTNFITATATLDGCSSAQAKPMVINISVPPSINAQALINDITACPGEAVQLISRDGPPLVNVTWTSPDKDVFISNPSSIAPLLSGFPAGNNVVYLSYSIQGCPDFTMDTVRVYIEFMPTASDDEYSLNSSQASLLPVTINDAFPAGSRITLTTPPAFGKAIVSGNGIVYTPDSRNLKEQILKYTLCADLCDDLCAEATVIIRLNEDVLCKSPNIFTPNGDGINDAFVIPCLSTGDFPQNSVVIFNEWGLVVFSAQPYTNNWEGTYAGQSLPAGTYYFILDTGDGSRPIGGFLVLQR